MFQIVDSRMLNILYARSYSLSGQFRSPTAGNFTEHKSPWIPLVYGYVFAPLTLSVYVPQHLIALKVFPPFKRLTFSFVSES